MSQRNFPLPRLLAIAAVFAVLIGLGTACQPDPPDFPVSSTWYIQLSGKVDMTQPAQVYDIDGYDNTAATVSSLKSLGKKVVCYVDLGSIENYRPDYRDFAPAALSKANPEWPDEQWLDILRLDVVGPTGKTARQLLQARLDMCKSKGFDAVDPDMIEVYAASNVTFSPAERKITYADQLTFNRWIASEAHARGMAVGLKGDIEQARDLEPSFDFVVNEECHHYNECDQLSSFVSADKSVLNIEYAGSNASFTSKVCPKAARDGFYSVKKKMSLNEWTLNCPR